MTAEIIAFRSSTGAQERPGTRLLRACTALGVWPPAPERRHEDQVTAVMVQISARVSELARLEPETWPRHVGRVLGAVLAAHPLSKARRNRRKPLIFAVPNLGDGPDDSDDGAA